MANTKKIGWLAGGRGKWWVAASAVPLLWLISWLVLPGVLAKQLQEKASQALGRTVMVRSVEVSPWSLAVTVHGLEVSGLPGKAPALTVERSYINASVTSLLRWAPVLDAMEFDQPVLRITQDAPGQWDFRDILNKLQSTSPSPENDAGVARLALYNIQVRDGRVELHDQVAGVQHTVDALQLQLPFISTLSSQREVMVEPKLSLRLNGSEIATQAMGTPFNATHSTQAKLLIEQLDLAPYAAYVPASSPVRLVQGRIDAEMHISFEQAEQPTVQLEGSTLQLSGVKLHDSLGQALGGWSAVDITLGDTRPLQQKVRLKAVTVQQPYGHIHRRTDGAFFPKAPAVDAVATSLNKDVASEDVASRAHWMVFLDQFEVQSGAVDWCDDLGQVGAVLRLQKLQLQAKNLTWPMGGDAQWELQAQLQGEDRVGRGRLRSWGQGVVERGQAAVIVEKFDAHAAQAYLQQWLRVPVGGLMSWAAGIAWNQGQVYAKVPSLRMESVALGQVAKPEVAWTGLQLQNLQLDMAAQQVQVERIALEAPSARVHRNAQGRWMYEQWLHPVAGAPAQGGRSFLPGLASLGRCWSTM